MTKEKYMSIYTMWFFFFKK